MSKKKKKKKSFTYFISPMSWILVIVGISIAVFVLFRPTFIEFFLAFIVVDSLSLMVANHLVFKIFYRLVPESRLYFFGVDSDIFVSLSEVDRIKLLESMMRFPRRYAFSLYLFSFIKAIPFYLITVFYWEHKISNFIQFLMILIFTAVCYFYFYGCALFDAHTKINLWIEDLHERINLTSEFEKLILPNKLDSLHFEEILVQVFIILFVLTLQSVIIISKQYDSSWELVFKISIIGILGLTLFTRIWYLGRKELFGGLNKIVSHMNNVDFNQNIISLSLHSSSLLASFEKTFNLLISRISNSERKLRGLVFLSAEKSRYHAIGEMSALIAHDLSAPLHAIQYCHREIKEREIPKELVAYIEHMELNITQAIDLTEALRARLKNDVENKEKSVFCEAHDFVVRLFETQFSTKVFERIVVTLAPEVAALILAIPRVDLMQILDNIYRNSIKNLLIKNCENPKLEIYCVNKSDSEVTIIISDNGSGLSTEEFNLMTEERNPESNTDLVVGCGLGLRLTRRLVEHYGGSLNIVQVTPKSAIDIGTQFSLRLKLYKA